LPVPSPTTWSATGACAGELITSQEGSPGYDLDLEAERLHAVLDGVALHALTMPERVTPDVMRAVIGAHLTDLCPR